MKKLFLLALLIPFALCGCNKKGGSENKEQYINVAVNEVSIHEEETYQIETEIIKKGTIVFYSSNNETVALVNDEGLVTAISEGEAIISVRGGKDTYNVYVTVLPYQPHDSLQVVLTKDSFTIAVNDVYVLPITVKFGNEVIENPNLSYTYEQGGIVSISNLEMTGLSAGNTTCVVTASYLDEQASKSFTVKVY